MMRALFAGVSGLRNHQVRLDVIGNNIANVNTVAFKSSRVTFKEAYAQLLQGASRPPGDLGGVNPMQIGLGMAIGSIDQNFSQGNLESTGQNTDLAIQGDGLFVVSDGKRKFYTRTGNFQLDADGRMICPANGYVVQGVLADSNGVISTGSAIGEIRLPFGQKSPAKATTRVTLSGNLDARETPLGTVLQTQGRVFAIEKPTDNTGMDGLYAAGMANNQVLGMTPQSTTVSVNFGGTTKTFTYVAQDTGTGDLAFHSLKDLVNEINNAFPGLTATQQADGSVTFTNASGATQSLNLSSSNSVLLKALQSANTVSLADGATSASTDQFSHVATTNDLVTDLRNGQGQSLGLAVGNTITIDGDVGGSAVGQGTLTVAAGTTYGKLLSTVGTTLGLVNGTGAEADAATGALKVTGDGGTARALTSLNIKVAGNTAFNAIFDSRPGNYKEYQTATDISHDLPITVYDSIGNPIDVTMRFTKDPTALNRWTFACVVPPPAAVTGGGTGSVTFDSDGHLQTFQYDGGSNSLQIDPHTGASAPVAIQLDGGKLGDINGLSQFASASNAVASSQDGYAMGNLQSISIDGRGVITGFFTNGVSQQLAQIALASFNNPSGLLRHGENMYEESANSGSAVIGFSGTSNQSVITPGALESSNVDISTEFTNMIVAQRGFQANARVITTADEMLTELVNLKR